MKKAIYFWRKGLWTLLSLFFLITIGISFLYLYLASQLPDVESLNTVHLQVPLRIYTQDGKLIQEYGEKKRIPVTYEEIPKMLIYALLATEDQRFFEHSGVDIFGLGRATLKMLKTGTKAEGGSTITMQVARNFFLSRKKTFLRKFNEILLAIKIDRELSKEKILELYLNKIYLGNRAYGVGAAANVYYGKSLKDLNLAELAMIAGLPQAPSTQNPIVNPAAARKRRDHVLERLFEEKYITEEQYKEALNQPITAKYHGAKVEVPAPYVAEMIRQSLYNHFGPAAYTKGYNVYTTIKAPYQLTANQAVAENLLSYDRRHGYRGPVSNIDIQGKPKESLNRYLLNYPAFNGLEPAIILNIDNQEAQGLTRFNEDFNLKWSGMSWARPALRKGWVGRQPTYAKQILKVGDIVYVRKQQDEWFLSQIPEIEAALIALNPNDGALLALVGGFNFDKSKFNRATQSNRQPGSSFKPFIYAAALDKGYTLATLVNDAPIVVEDPSQPDLWRPRNDTLTFNGPTRLKEALVRSRNMVSIRVLDDLGLNYAINYVSRFGFHKENLPRGLSLALGSLSVSPMELTTAYAVFANGGYKIEPYLIDHITDNEGEVLLQAKPAKVCQQDCEQNATPDSSSQAPRVIPADTAFLMTSALKGVVQHGTAHAANILDRQDLAGKTGTTNDQVDAWFAGFTPDLVVTTWVGYDAPHSLHEYAASIALPMWIDFMKVALQDIPERALPQPKNIVAVRIDPQTGLLAKQNQDNSIVEYFREQDVPNEEGPANTSSFATSQEEQKEVF
ncbi:penicillin binding protein 1A [Legionella busanensis]|uniref:Penicillin-binding protein 1A n=1 Tax=Legionella busanensis TaxID=190655 RepID=A0A378JI60_9GAMM|nr:penicillin-binding protein 1A [Legionella busanensis]STX50717.1 penicillin binding protein 1A [Legionella busanensis]